MFKKFHKWLGINNQIQAQNARHRISILYAFLGWNTFAVCFYTLVKKHIPEDRAERRKSYKRLGASENMHVYQVSGLTLTNDFDITNETEEDKESVRIDENM